MKYKLTYVYDCYTLGCDCCTESRSTVCIFDENDVLVLELEGVELMENAEELLAYIREVHPKYKDAVVNETDCLWF